MIFTHQQSVETPQGILQDAGTQYSGSVGANSVGAGPAGTIKIRALVDATP